MITATPQTQKPMSTDTPKILNTFSIPQAGNSQMILSYFPKQKTVCLECDVPGDVLKVLMYQQGVTQEQYEWMCEQTDKLINCPMHHHFRTLKYGQPTKLEAAIGRWRLQHAL